MPKNMISVDVSDLKKLRDQLQGIVNDRDEIMRQLTNEIAARLLRRVKMRTPVGKTTKTHKGGTLRRGWRVGDITKNGDIYEIEIINNVEYAPYVEYGHRTANHKGWVRGRFMLTISEKEISSQVDKIIEKRLEKIMKGAIK